MAAEMRLYRVTVIGSNAERKRGKVVEEVTVKVGTKWLTDDNGRRYYKVPLEDANRNLYFQLNTMYCMPAASARTSGGTARASGSPHAFIRWRTGCASVSWESSPTM